MSSVIEIRSILVDTCFLISLVNENDALHKNAEDYFRWALDHGMTLLISTISLSEFYEKQEKLEIEENFQLIPFGYEEALIQHKYFPREELKGHSGDEKVVVKDDIKIIASGIARKVDAVLSSNDDFNVMAADKELKVINFSTPLSTFLGQLPLG